jgi:outer membrane protein TolC
VVTGVRSTGRAFEAAGSNYDALRLDVIQAAGQTYLDYLRVLALVQIDVANLRLTRSNLLLAEERQKVGYAGREEVYRWESEEARQRAVVIASQATLEQARVALNQVLGIDQTRRWRARDVEIPAGGHGFLEPTWGRVFEDSGLDEALESFVAEQALEASPSLASVGSSIEAQTLEVGRVKRSFYLPSFQASLTYGRDFDPDEGTGGILIQQDDTWVATVTASLPLFRGTDRLYELRESRANLALVTDTRVQLAQFVEQRARSALYALRGSHPAIELNRSAAESSIRNLEIVRDNYAFGRASIIDLLDAQSQAFRLKQQAAIAVYDYLDDLLEFQRSISFFEPLESAESRSDLVTGLETLASREQGE